ncbi:hypothetical protein [Cellulophaga baltica]|uniref:hypothetical protein n=1 Tax=Cellulophaga baltica TaxID=76594 RepID=UPI002495803C|nr:hypothetical protein [Cellulophaga baltica]
MKTTVLAFLLFCCLGATPKRPVCSPVFTPFNEWLHRYDAERFIIVEGYFLPTTEKGHASKFKVIRSSDASIKLMKTMKSMSTDRLEVAAKCMKWGPILIKN